MQSMHIQQDNLEADGGSYQHGLQLEGARMELVEEFIRVNLLEEETKQKSSDEETPRVDSIEEWQYKTRIDEEDSMGD